MSIATIFVLLSRFWTAKSARARVAWCNQLELQRADSKQACHEVSVRLLTGRTHQIRAQLSALQAPVLGDVMYTPLAGLVFPADGKPSEQMLDGIAAAQVQSSPLGLHAWEMTWDGLIYVAAAPWH